MTRDEQWRQILKNCVALVNDYGDSSFMQCCYCGNILPTISDTTPEMLEGLVEKLRGKVICGVTIHDAKAELSTGPDNGPCIEVRLLLDDPDPAEKVWPVAASLGIQKEVLRVAHELNMSEWPYVTSRVALSEAHLVNWPIPDGIELHQ